MRILRKYAPCFLSAFFLLVSFTLDAQAPRNAAAPGTPTTAVNEVKETIHGVEIIDPYRWLEDQNSPQTRSWIDAQNAYTDSLLAKIPGRDALRQSVSGFLRTETMGLPTARNDRYFFTHREPTQDQALLYIRRGATGKDEVLI